MKAGARALPGRGGPVDGCGFGLFIGALLKGLDGVAVRGEGGEKDVVAHGEADLPVAWVALGAELEVAGSVRGDFQAPEARNPARGQKEAEDEPPPAREARAPEDGLPVGTVFGREGEDGVASGRKRDENAPARFVAELQDVDVGRPKRVRDGGQEDEVAPAAADVEMVARHGGRFGHHAVGDLGMLGRMGEADKQGDERGGGEEKSLPAAMGACVFHFS